MKSLIFAFFLICQLALCAEEMDQVNKVQGFKKVGAVLDRLNSVFVKNNLPPLTFSPTDVLVYYPKDINRQITLWEFQTLTASIDFIPGSFELIGFDRLGIKYSSGTGFDTPPKPTWTPQQAVDAAKEYMTPLFGKLSQTVGQPTTKYESIMNLPKGSSTMRYYPGIWHVRWPRVDFQGHPFASDSIYIAISESQGLTSAANSLCSEYQEPVGPLISEAEALKIAAPAAESLVGKWLGGGFQLGVPEVIECIVNPNHVLQAKTIEEMTKKDSIARLVWAVHYDLTANGKPASGHGVQVWVDAQTQEVVGGDLH